MTKSKPNDEHPLEPWKEDFTSNVKPGWKDPTCQKCGMVLANRMMFVCSHSYCPSGLN